MEQKDRSVETLRGIAIILVVGLHITSDGALAPAKDFYDYLAYSFQNIRIPLFAVISGYLYGLRPVKANNFYYFIKGKVRRIALPLFTVATVEYLAKSILPGVNNPEPIQGFWRATLFPYEHFWFLQVILLIFIVYAILGAYQWLPNWINWLRLMIFSTVLYLAFPLLNANLSFFSMGAVSYLLPFFTLGFGLANYGHRIFAPNLLYVWISMFLFSILCQQILWFSGDTEEAGKRTVIGLLVALTSGVLIFYYRRSLYLFSFVGSYAFTIYLYQGFGTSIARRLPISDFGPHIYFFMAIMFTVIFGIIVEIVLRRVPVICTFALGLKSSKSTTQSKN